MDQQNALDYESIFKDDAVFLTGATGNLGSCTLYKLISQLNATRVYVLVRGSKEQATKKWQRKMKAQAHHLTNSNAIRFVVGDMRLPGWSISNADLHVLQRDVSIVIHTAANISLLAPIRECIQNNCDPVLDLARLAMGFKRLRRFIFVSSVYVNSFLPDGPVKEKIYPLLDAAGEDIDPELERETIVRTKHSPHTKKFAWPYAFSKYLAERLLLERYSHLPLLIVRASTISPAARDPFSLFGEEESLPFQQAAKIYCRDPEASKVWHCPSNSSSGTNILDEIPVDWVSNVLLLHTAHATRGIVHASAANYLRRSANELLELISRLANAVADGERFYHGVKWVAPSAGPQSALANHFVVGNRDWDFDCKRSAALQQVEGPLSIRITKEAAMEHNDQRFLGLREDMMKELQLHK